MKSKVVLFLTCGAVTVPQILPASEMPGLSPAKKEIRVFTPEANDKGIYDYYWRFVNGPGDSKYGDPISVQVVENDEASPYSNIGRIIVVSPSAESIPAPNREGQHREK